MTTLHITRTLETNAAASKYAPLIVLTALVLMQFSGVAVSKGVAAAPRERQANSEAEAAREIGDVSTPERKKRLLLQHVKITDPTAWGPRLTNVLQQAKNNDLKELVVIRLRSLGEWQQREPALLNVATNTNQTTRVRTLALEGLTLFTSARDGDPPAEIEALATSEKDVAVGIAALKVVERIYPSAFERIAGASAGARGILSQSGSSTPERQLGLSEQDESELRSQLRRPKDGSTLRIIQALANATQDETVALLKDLYDGESDANRAEIALTIAKMARKKAALKGQVDGFIEAKLAVESSELVKEALRGARTLLHE